MITWDDVVRCARRARRFDARITYGTDEFQFGHLWLPSASDAAAPIVALIHGGCWRAEYGVDHVAGTAAALADEGYAVWAPEYRRLGNAGGGWPGTFDDIGRSVDNLIQVATNYPIDLGRVVIVGHSAGGQLAVWAATRFHEDDEALRPVGAMSLAGILDLATYGASAGSCNDSVTPLLGGTTTDVRDRYRAVSPIERLPIRVPVALVHGSLDPTVPLAMSEDFARRSTEAGDDVSLAVVRDAGHFDVITPGTAAWEAVLKGLRNLLTRD